MSVSLNDMIKDAIMAADARKAALQRGVPLPISSDASIKPDFAYINYGELNTVTPTRHLNYTGYSKMSRYPEQVQEVKARMIAKRNGSLKVLNIGVAQGQEPLTHINTAFELSQNSAKTISDFLDLKTVDILHFAPELPVEAKKLNPAVIRHKPLMPF